MRLRLTLPLLTCKVQDTSTLLAIAGAVLTWTTSVIILAGWLHAKFRFLESTIYREMEKRRALVDREFRIIETKMQRLEIKAFGFTTSPLSAFEKLVDPSDDPPQ